MSATGFDLGEWSIGRKRQHKEILLDPIREAFRRSGMTVAEVANRGGLDWTHANRLLTEANTTCVKRGKRYGPYPYRTTTYPTACKLALGLGLDPVDFDL